MTWSREPKPWAPPEGQGPAILAHIESKTVEEGECLIYLSRAKKTPMVKPSGCQAVNVQRAVFVLRGGVLKPNGYITTKCLNPNCIHPDHIVQVSQSKVASRAAKHVNHQCEARAMKIAAKRRQASKWSDDTIDVIRASSKPTMELASEFGMSPSMVRRVRSGVQRRQSVQQNPWVGLFR
jgi:hypothetical protein